MAATAGAQSLPICATPGVQGSPSPIAAIVNSYWTVGTNGAYGAASGSIPLASRRGAALNLAPGDLALVIQMQCANLNVTDSLVYGNGVAGEPAAGFTDPAGTCLAGRYQMVRAGPSTSATSLDLSATPLSLTFVQAAATTTQGRRTFQVVRVPQYQNATLTGTLTAANWDAFSGGIVAIDVAGTLNFNGFGANVNGSGFRGGAGLTASANDAQERFRWDDATRHAVKGEGIAGTPRFVSNKRTVDDSAVSTNTDLSTVENPWGGYPTGTSSTGDYARGAPANGGGGGAFWNGTNDNGGGGGGGNGAAGGRGGAGWRSAGWVGINADYANMVEKKWGFGGVLVPRDVGRLILGGGGGAGDNNNNSADVASSGAAGGGLVMFRAGTMSGNGSILARGAWAPNNLSNDGGGGGGAGGSVLLFAGASSATLAVDVSGGRGGDAFQPGTTPHGPGGGGSGGVIIRSASVAVATPTLTGGAPGITNLTGCPGGTQCAPGGAPHGAQTGGTGVNLEVTVDADPSIAGYRCQADLAVIKSNAVNVLVAGATTTYTLTVANNGLGVAHGAILTDSPSAGLVPTGVTCVSATGGASCPVPPSLSLANLLGAGIPIANFPAGATVTFQVTANVTATGQ